MSVSPNRRKARPRGIPFARGAANPQWQHGKYASENISRDSRPLFMVFRDYTEKAAHALARILETADNDDLRLRAASVILQRGWGDAPKALQVSAITDSSRINELTEADILAMLRGQGQQREQLPVIEVEQAPPSEGDEGETPNGTG